MSYEGLWTNGFPVNIATKMLITCDSQIEVIQGTPFDLEIHTVNDEGDIIEGK